MKIHSDMNYALSDILAKLEEPSCHERTASVTAERLTAWAKEMSASGYRMTEDALEALRLYLSGYGLLLLGNVGAGKTYFFRVLGDIQKRRNGTPPPIVFPMLDTAGRKLDEIREWFNERIHGEIVIDDIGAEPTFNEYGNRWDILPWIIEMRLAASGRTHFTTNLTSDELRKRYGVRTLDRLQELAAAVQLTGKSQRRTKPNAATVRAYNKALTAQAAKLPPMPQ